MTSSYTDNQVRRLVPDHVCREIHFVLGDKGLKGKGDMHAVGRPARRMGMCPNHFRWRTRTDGSNKFVTCDNRGEGYHKEFYILRVVYLCKHT